MAKQIAIKINTLDGKALIVETMEAGSALLIGREPDQAKLNLSINVPCIRNIQFVHPWISANHVLIVYEHSTVRICDLGSSNGTELRVPQEKIVQVENAEAITICLAPDFNNTSSPALPSDILWNSDSDFSACVASQISTWLTKQDLQASVRVEAVPSSSNSSTLLHASDPTEFALPQKHTLYVKPHSTTDPRWPHIRQRIYEFIKRQERFLETENKLRNSNFLYVSSEMRKILREVLDAARQRLPVLLLGGTGVGKGELAQIYHGEFGANKKFIPVFCTGLTRDFIHAQLFGALKGSFTSCIKDIPGAIEKADGGIIFLDEIGELDQNLQGQLLQFVERKEYNPLGDYGEPRTADVTLIYATNRDLRAMVRDGTFREDLWYRISFGRVIKIPPLYERPDDIRQYLNSIPKSVSSIQTISAFEALSPESQKKVSTYLWPGNFRELKGFAMKLPMVRNPGEVGIDLCEQYILEGSVNNILIEKPIQNEAVQYGQGQSSFRWLEIANEAMQAWLYKHSSPQIHTWQEVNDFVEHYLKAFIFYQLCRISPRLPEDRKERAQLGRLLNADPNTAEKQLTRYMDILKELGKITHNR